MCDKDADKESRTFSILINFSNPYILDSEILDGIIHLKKQLDCHICVITTNYFLTPTVRSKLNELRNNNILKELLIVPLYSLKQILPSRPSQRYLSNLRNYAYVKRICQQPIDLALFHTTNELADLIALQMLKYADTQIGVLRPTSCEEPSTYKQGNKAPINRRVKAKIYFVFEELTRIFVYLVIIRNLEIFRSKYSTFHGREFSDFALCSTNEDAQNLRKQIRTRRIDVVDFSHDSDPLPEHLGSFVLFLLPLFSNHTEAMQLLHLIPAKLVEEISKEKFPVLVRFHPRTMQSLTEKICLTLSQWGLSVINEHSNSHNLVSLLKEAKKILVVGETSTKALSLRLRPEATFFYGDNRDGISYEEPLGDRPTFSSYVYRFLMNSKADRK